MTIGITKTLLKFADKEGDFMKVVLWDTGGHERFRSLTKQYVRDVGILFLCYDVNERSSFTNLRYWLNYAREATRPNTKVVLFETKCDLPRRVDQEEAEEFAKNEGMQLYSVSSKNEHQI